MITLCIYQIVGIIILTIVFISLIALSFYYCFLTRVEVRMEKSIMTYYFLSSSSANKFSNHMIKCGYRVMIYN